MCFFIMAQVKELLFRGLPFELYNAQMQIRADNVVNALEILPHPRAIGEYITRSWDVLSTISPEGFNQFRDSLGSASGQLSFMYRHVELILGNKDRRLASVFRNTPHVWPAVEAALNSRSLYDDVIALLARRGLPVDAAELLKNAAPDGDTVMIAPIVVPVLAPLTVSKLNYNPATDFAPILHVASFHFGLAVPADAPYKTLAEFIAWLKANPAKANFGMPAAALAAINSAGNRALASPDLVERVAKLALEMGGGSAADLVSWQDAEVARWGPVIKASGFRAD